MVTLTLNAVNPSVDSSGLIRCRRHEVNLWICGQFGERKWNAGPWMEMDADHPASGIKTFLCDLSFYRRALSQVVSGGYCLGGGRQV